MSTKFEKFVKVNESFTFNRYENGFMVDMGGRDKDGDWINTKLIFNTEEELIKLIKQYNAKPLAD